MHWNRRLFLNTVNIKKIFFLKFPIAVVQLMLFWEKLLEKNALIPNLSKQVGWGLKLPELCYVIKEKFPDRTENADSTALLLNLATCLIHGLPIFPLLEVSYLATTGFLKVSRVNKSITAGWISLKKLNNSKFPQIFVGFSHWASTGFSGGGEAPDSCMGRVSPKGSVTNNSFVCLLKVYF